MAETSKEGILNNAGKFLRRRKTKVLQSLGKTGRTTDDILSEECQKLEKQQEVATRFQKDLRSYIHNAKALSVASKTFYTTLSETYEPEWEEQEGVVEILKNMDMLWQDYVQKLQDQVQDRLTKYLACIPQIKARVAKSRRKLIDYDDAKHNLEVHENAKKKDDAKITKAKEDLEHAKKIYEGLNNDVHQELPEFYRSRVSFYGELFKELFEAENRFHTESGKVWEAAPSCDFPLMGAEKVEEVARKLSAANAQNTYTPRKNLRNTIVIDNDVDLTNGHNQSSTDIESPSTSTPTSPATSPSTNEPVRNGNADTSKDSFDDSAYEMAEMKTEPAVVLKEVIDDAKVNGDSKANRESKTSIDIKATGDSAVQNNEAEVKQIETDQANVGEKGDVVKEDIKEQVKEVVKEEVKKAVTDEVKPMVNGEAGDLKDSDGPTSAPPPVPASPPPEEDKDTPDGIHDEELYQVPPPAKPIDNFLPANYLYTVVATHSYKGEDEDELSFDSHEIIYVMKYDDPEEQDPGWLMGMRKSDQVCGVFPENFTKPVLSDQSNTA